MDKDLKAISDALRVPFGRDCIKSRVGAAGRRFDYIEGYLIIHRLNDATGNQWDFRVTEMKQTGTLWTCMGELTIPGMGTRTGFGVQVVAEKSGEDLIKGALTDAIKHAAKHFGVAIDLYGVDREDEEYQASAAPPVRPADPKPASQRPRMKLSKDEKGAIQAAVEAGGGNIGAAPFLGWLSKNTANNAASLEDVLAEDYEDVLLKLEALAKKRAAT